MWQPEFSFTIASPIPSQESARETGESPASPSTTSAWLTNHTRGGSYGKMSLAYSPAPADLTLPHSSLGCAAGKSPCQGGGGKTQESAPTPPDATAWRGECLTLNIREFPDFLGQFRSADGGCSSSDTVVSLSEVLWTGSVPPRYYLTERACLGILRRAERRGKELPEMLKDALERQADHGMQAE